ncbi:MAG: hypothetical protein ABIH42_01785 [Planctomycetota bacterium]
MAVKDFQINTQVRRILARHWIDVNVISIMTVRGTVFLQGKFVRIAANPENKEIKEDDMVVLDREMKSIPGVRQIVFHIEDWLKDGGIFIRVKSEQQEKKEEKEKQIKKEGKGGNTQQTDRII